VLVPLLRLADGGTADESRAEDDAAIDGMSVDELVQAALTGQDEPNE
jgi:hypothetical protein